MTFHSEALSTTQQRLLQELGPVAADRGFRLGGGTALAVWLGHRRSVDFDWFTPDPLRDPLRLAKQLQDEGIPLTVTQTDRGTLYATARRVRISFFEYRYPDLGQPIEWPDYRCRLVSLPDLACMKLAAVAQRGAKKDFVDLYAVIQQGCSLRGLLDMYQHKYGIHDIGHVFYSLTYFDDADSERMPRLLHPLDWRTVKRTIRTWAKQAAD